VGLSDYWTFDALAPQPSKGGDQTLLGAFLALGYHSYRTLVRLALGLVIGIVTGIASGLLVSYWRTARRVAWAQMNFLRMVPLLAAIPLGQFWLGANTRGVVLFVAFGVWVVLVVATMNAVGNVPDRYLESARTLGASRFRTYLTIIIPGSMPELRTSMLLAAGFSWSLTIGAEYLGLQEGLGPILASSEYFTNTGRMVVVAGLATLFAWAGFRILDRLAARTMTWMPQLESGSIRSEAVGAAALGGGLAAEWAEDHVAEEEFREP
jgi:ABC-type nitrate/sulfonate/bicarbonate transport system permease component